MPASGKRDWWKFWSADAWRTWWGDRKAWAPYRRERSELDRRIRATEAELRT